MSFFSDFLKDAQHASEQTGVLVSVILAQWSDETGSGRTLSGPDTWNFAGITNPATGNLFSYQTKDQGVAAYVETMNLPYYTAVRQALGWHDQCVALGNSPWAGAKYDANDYNAGRPLVPGIDLLSIISSNNLTQYDSGLSGGGTVAFGTSPGDDVQSVIARFHAANPQVSPPPVGFRSDIGTDSIIINGQSLDVDVSEALTTAQLDLSLAQASTITLTLHDPDRWLINSPIFAQASILNFSNLAFQLVSVEKSGSVLTAAFESWSIAALRKATGPFTITPGTMTRTAFAQMLVSELEGVIFTQAPDSYLSSIQAGYDHTNKEQLSRGTFNAPLEDSWTCLQRLASEIQWVCFESFGEIYFGPYSYLTSVTPVLYPREFHDGIDTIDGTFDVGQPLGEITVTCVADSWSPVIGDCVRIEDLGPFNGNWLVSKMERVNLMEPDITITLEQPLPGLPEPSSGGSNAAVGAGWTGASTQTAGGLQAAQGAVAFALSKVGLSYSESLDAGLGPDYYDCSGLCERAYESVGIEITRTTYTQWPSGAGPAVPSPPDASNLLPGDLCYFAYVPGGQAEHVVMVVNTNIDGSVHIVAAADTALGIITDNFTPTLGANSGGIYYLGALRPAP